jgi:hypothetical protein
MLHAHHICPVRVSKSNHLANLISLCPKCHKRLEEVGFSILQNGGHQTDVKRVEMQMISESRKIWQEELYGQRNGNKGTAEDTGKTEIDAGKNDIDGRDIERTQGVDESPSGD